MKNETKVKKMKQEKEVKKILNPTDYAYKEDSKTEIQSNIILEVIRNLDALLADEIKVESKFKYAFIDANGKKVNKVKQSDIQEGKVKKIVDVSKTIDNPTFETSITEKGVIISKIKRFFENLHNDNIQKGEAIPLEELFKKDLT